MTPTPIEKLVIELFIRGFGISAGIALVITSVLALF